MDRFQEMQVFVVVCEELSFAAAARKLGMSAPSVTRAVAALEKRIGSLLLARTTRSVHLSDAGRRYLDDCRRILSELDEAEDTAGGGLATPYGLLSVTAPVLFGELFITPLVADYLDKFNEVSVDALLVDRVIDINEEGVDVAIRIGAPQDNGLVSIKVGEVRQVVCGSPAYFAKNGKPSHPHDLDRTRVILSSAASPLGTWTFDDAGMPIIFKPKQRFTVSANQPAINGATLGWGLTRVLSYQVARRVADGDLSIVLEDFEPPALPIHVCYQPNKSASGKVRTFVDFCVERLSADLALNPQRPG